MILNRGSKVEMEVNMYVCREEELGGTINEQIWEDRAGNFVVRGVT